MYILYHTDEESFFFLNSMKNHIEIIAFMKFLETCWFIYVSVNNAHNWWQNLDTFQFTEISPGNVIKSGLLYHQDSFLLETQLWHPDWTFCFADGFHQAGARKHWSSYNTGKFIFSSYVLCFQYDAGILKVPYYGKGFKMNVHSISH